MKFDKIAHNSVQFTFPKQLSSNHHDLNAILSIICLPVQSFSCSTSYCFEHLTFDLSILHLFQRSAFRHYDTKPLSSVIRAMEFEKYPSLMSCSMSDNHVIFIFSFHFFSRYAIISGHSTCFRP